MNPREAMDGRVGRSSRGEHALAKRALGGTGLAFSVLGLGTVKLGRDTQVKYPGRFEIPDDAGAAGLLEAAQELGVDTIDTAPAYGTSEERLGKLLAGSRDRWNLITKAGEEFEDGESRFDFSAGAVRRSLERSLLRLRTDRVELLLIHSDGVIESAMPDELWRELHAIRREGKARAIGVSTKTPGGAAACLPRCDALMLTLNPAHRDDLPLIEESRRRGVGVIVKKALASGHDADPSAALRFAATTPGVTSVIVGTIDRGHLASNCRAVAGIA
jgi:aryl-alcohol dehydrogenase-like predicted oxidoreductase